jgi:Rnl2 family RNA ligase
MESKTVHKKYSSAENTYNIKFVNKVKLHTPKNTIWMIQEKIHGANFSIFYEKKTDTVQFGKRTSLIEDDEKFFDCQSSFPEWERLTRTLLDAVGHKVKETLTIRGELCGGRYPEYKSTRGSVQKGIDYCDRIVFVAFGLQIDGVYVPLNTAITDLQLAGFYVVRILKMCDTLDEVLDYDIDFSSKLPEELGMSPHPEKNQCEGIVIKPREAFYLPTGKRVLLKKKNDAFKEVTRQIKKSEKRGDKYDNVVDYINEARYNSVVSKLSEDTPPKVVALKMIEDVIQEYLALHEITEKKEKKKIRKKVSPMVFQFVIRM